MIDVISALGGDGRCYFSAVPSLTVREPAWLKSSPGAFSFFFGCFLAREASAWWSEYVFLRSFGMSTVSHTPVRIHTPVYFQLDTTRSQG